MIYFSSILHLFTFICYFSKWQIKVKARSNSIVMLPRKLKFRTLSVCIQMLGLEVVYISIFHRLHLKFRPSMVSKGCIFLPHMKSLLVFIFLPHSLYKWTQGEKKKRISLFEWFSHTKISDQHQILKSEGAWWASRKWESHPTHHYNFPHLFQQEMCQ